MIDAEAKFLKEGARRYAEALETLDAVQEILKKELVQVLQRRTDWQPFTPGSKGITAWGGRGLRDATVKAEIEGTWAARSHRVEIAAWWRPKGLKEDLIFYVRLMDLSAKGLAKLEPQSEHGSGRIKRLRELVYIVPSENLDFQGDFDTLIDALLRMMSKTTQ